MQSSIDVSRFTLDTASKFTIKTASQTCRQQAATPERAGKRSCSTSAPDPAAASQHDDCAHRQRLRNLPSRAEAAPCSADTCSTRRASTSGHGRTKAPCRAPRTARPVSARLSYRATAIVPRCCRRPAARLPLCCRHPAARLPLRCRRPAAGLPLRCRHPTARLPLRCRHPAARLPLRCRHPAASLPLRLPLACRVGAARCTLTYLL